MLGCLAAPASAAPGRPSAPWVVASTPSSVTLTWTSSGASRYRVSYARSASAAARSSAPSRTTEGRTRTIRLRGLRAGTTYCFTVRAVKGRRAGSPSAAHCHSTRRPVSATASAPLSVVTYNVCGVANNCGSWTASRQRAVLAQIDRSKADLVALQEVGRRRSELVKPLEARGYRKVGFDADVLMYYRTSRLEINIDAQMTPVCRDQPVDPAATADWRPGLYLRKGIAYVFVDGQWFVSAEPCPAESVRVNTRYGDTSIGHGAVLAYATLYDRVTGRTPVFMNVHLKNGRSRQAVRIRRLQTTALLSELPPIAGDHPVVLMGDFNSDATRSDDVVGRALTKAGLVDTYQNSATYTRPQVNSFNGYRRVPRRDERWGGHIDRVFTSAGVGASRWEVVAQLRRGRYTGPRASDHHPVRVSLSMP